MVVILYLHIQKVLRYMRIHQKCALSKVIQYLGASIVSKSMVAKMSDEGVNSVGHSFTIYYNISEIWPQWFVIWSQVFLAAKLVVKVASFKAQPAEDGQAVTEAVCQDPREQVPVSRSERLAELLECSRYLLTSYSFLVQTLSCHPLVKGNARCLAVVDKISRYLSNTGLQQEWCPPEAIHRGGENVKNVFLIYDGSGNARVMYPPSAQCYKRTYTFMDLKISFGTASCIFYHGGSLLILDFGNNFLLHIATADEWNTKINC
ncbi:hypothetical protein PoB_005307700 [Plakobranchus ocellatus]|uniref:Uncharacterized protein n=1 Tax=Plakobranchus ocellatus TaxID=259542 RepID=A0AAV4C5C8_9GAST|nr:hypothetical protein PoB_005307700 [Plakobranchus ocellatus]